MDIRLQAITGVIPPQQAEALIRETFPSVASSPAIANLGRKFTGTIFLAPLAWLIMSAIYFGKLLPFMMRRYTLTNRRVMIREGWAKTPGAAVALENIDNVRVVADSNSEFFRAADLELTSSAGNVLLTLPGVPDPESFRQAILNTCNAWVPGRTKSQPFMPASAAK